MNSFINEAIANRNIVTPQQHSVPSGISASDTGRSADRKSQKNRRYAPHKSYTAAAAAAPAVMSDGWARERVPNTSCDVGGAGDPITERTPGLPLREPIILSIFHHVLKTVQDSTTIRHGSHKFKTPSIITKYNNLPQPGVSRIGSNVSAPLF